MACGTAHRVVAAATVGIALAYSETKNGELTAKSLIGAGLGALLGTLPDIIEPADHPNHRQFFHGVIFAAVLGYAGYKIFQWQPQEDWQKALRFVGMIAIGAYLIHLVMDAMTPKSLPLVGKI
jgi:membrane-bound metal-dependent hydrolase YbcI (DUF457 family)